ncbi:MAG: NfeD family protein [Thermodesulfobacteriota bacterium]
MGFPCKQPGFKGYVFVDGELWKAFCRVPLGKGDKVIIQKAQGLTLTVDLVNPGE